MHLGTLHDGLGSFPLDHGPYTRSLSCCIWLPRIRSLVRFGRDFSPLAYSVLYPMGPLDTTLYLNKFREERAISGLDWPITPNHRSSEFIATNNGSVLRDELPPLQPAHS